MAYGRKYFYEFSSDPYPSLGVASERFRVSFFWKDFVGTATELKTTRSSTRISYTDNNDSITSPIRAKLLTMQLVAEGDIDLDEFYAESDRDCYVTIDKHITGSTYTAPEFTGWLSAFDGKEPFICKPYTFELKAYCGLASLKDFTFSSTGKITFNEAIRLCLLNTGFALNYATAIETRLSGHSGDPTQLYSFYADRLNGLDCYEALTEILKSFLADIEQQGNIWLLRGIVEMAQDTTKLYTYNSVGTAQSSNVTTDYSRPIGRIRNNRNIRGAMTRSNPALSYVEISYELGPVRNLLTNGSFTDSTTVGSTIFFTDWDRNNLTNLDVQKMNPGIKIKGRGEIVALNSMADFLNPLGPLLQDNKYYQHHAVDITGAESIVFRGEFTPFELDYAKFEVYIIDPDYPAYPVWMAKDGTWKEQREVILLDYKAAVVRSFGDLPPTPASYPFEIKSSGSIPVRRAPATWGTRPYVNIRYSQLIVRIYRGAYNNQSVQVSSPTGPYIIYNNLFVSFTARDEDNFKLVYGFKNAKYVRKNALKFSTAFGGFSVQLSEITSRKREAFLNSYASVILRTDGTEIIDEWVKPGSGSAVYDFIRLNGISRLKLNAAASKIWEGGIVGLGLKSSDIAVFDDLAGRFKPTSWEYDYVTRITNVTLHQLLSDAVEFTESLEETTGNTSSNSGSSVSVIRNTSVTEPVVENPDYNPSVLHKVGGIDPTTGLPFIPVLRLDQQGRVRDFDHSLGNLWFRVRGEVADLGDILALHPTNAGGALPLAAQNGFAGWWKRQIETLTSAPTGLTGRAEIIGISLGMFRVVVVYNDGGQVYNYTSDITAEPVVWSGWQYPPRLTAPGEQNKVIASEGATAAKNVNIWAHNDGKFSVGMADKISNAFLSVWGTVAGADPVDGKDFVNKQSLFQFIAALVSDDDLNAVRNELLNELENKADRSHRHPMSDIDNLYDELNKYLNKGVFTGGQPYFAAVRDADGLATMADLSRVLLLIDELPPAQEGVSYSFTIPGPSFVFPFGSVDHEVITTCAKKVRGSLGWMTVSNYNSATGVTLSGTPGDDEDTVVFVKMRWKMAASAKQEEQQFGLSLAVYPADAVLTAPNAPLGLTATAVSSTQINLTWTDNSSNESGFELDYSLDNSVWTRLINTTNNVTNYPHTGLTASTHYFYRLRAYGALQSDFVYADTTTDATPTPPDFEEDWVDGSARLKVDSPTPVVTLPNTPTIVWLQHPSANQVNLRCRNNHFAGVVMEFQARQVGTTDWYTYRNDAAFVLTTTTPMQISFNAGAESTVFNTSSFFSGKIIEMRIRVIANGAASIWTDPKSE